MDSLKVLENDQETEEDYRENLEQILLLDETPSYLDLKKKKYPVLEELLLSELARIEDRTTTYDLDELKHLKKINKLLVLSQIALTWKYAKLLETHNEKIASFEREIVLLRNALEKSQQARTYTFKLPEEWHVEDNE